VKYTTLFNGYAELCQYDEIYLLRKYQDGLSKALYKKVNNMFPIPETLKNWKERALKLDRVHHRGLQQSDDRKEYRPTVTVKKTELKRDPMAMDIDAMLIEKKNGPMKKGACFYCKGVGHIS
jgi:hypothetical protein